ncbi:MAG: hypothetical protein R3C05_26935 [Pirellulaceae bacterium]
MASPCRRHPCQRIGSAGSVWKDWRFDSVTDSDGKYVIKVPAYEPMYDVDLQAGVKLSSLSRRSMKC